MNKPALFVTLQPVLKMNRCDKSQDRPRQETARSVPFRVKTFFSPGTISFVLVVLVLVAYWPVTQNGFISLDDQDYVTENSHVKSGLTWANIVWAFRSTEAHNWHPLTWLSHSLDCEIFGLRAGLHHLVSVLIHAVNTLLLFL